MLKIQIQHYTKLITRKGTEGLDMKPIDSEANETTEQINCGFI